MSVTKERREENMDAHKATEQSAANTDARIRKLETELRLLRESLEGDEDVPLEGPLAKVWNWLADWWHVKHPDDPRRRVRDFARAAIFGILLFIGLMVDLATRFTSSEDLNPALTFLALFSAVVSVVGFILAWLKREDWEIAGNTMQYLGLILAVSASLFSLLKAPDQFYYCRPVQGTSDAACVMMQVEGDTARQIGSKSITIQGEQ